MPTTGLFKNLSQGLRYVSNNAARYRQSGSRGWSKYRIRRNGQPGTENSNPGNNRTGYYQKEEKNKQGSQGSQGNQQGSKNKSTFFYTILGGGGVGATITGAVKAEDYANNAIEKGLDLEGGTKEGTPAHDAKKLYNQMGPINSMHVLLKYKVHRPGLKNPTTAAVNKVNDIRTKRWEKYEQLSNLLKNSWGKIF